MAPRRLRVATGLAGVALAAVLLSAPAASGGGAFLLCDRREGKDVISYGTPSQPDETAREERENREHAWRMLENAAIFTPEAPRPPGRPKNDAPPRRPLRAPSRFSSRRATPAPIDELSANVR